MTQGEHRPSAVQPPPWTGPHVGRLPRDTGTSRESGPTGSARTIARLKWRLWQNGFRRSGAQVLGTLLSIALSLTLGGATALLCVASRNAALADRRTALTLVAVVASVLALIAPVMAGGIDETLPVNLLRQYPIGRRQLLSGLLMAGMVGAAPVGLAIGVLGAVVSSVRSPVGLLLAAVAGIVFFIETLVTSRLLTTLFARAMNSRRGRDAAVALVSLAGLSGLVLQVLGRYVASLGPSRLRALGRFSRWTPPGALGRAMVDGGRGQIGPAVVGLGIGLIGLGAAIALWWWALSRLDEQDASERTAKRPRRQASLFAGIGWLPRTAIGAVAARQVRSTLRDPRRRVGMIISLALGVVFPLINNAGRGASATVLFASGASWLLVLSGMNQFGIDGRALWFDLMSGASPETLLKGRSLGQVIFAVPVVLTASITLAALTNGWAYVPAALLVGVATALAGMGAAGLVSTVAPMRVPEGSNPFAMNTSGQGCIAPILGLLGMAVIGILLLPVAVGLILWRDRPLACAALGLVAVPYCALLWTVALRLAVRRLIGREPELVALVDPRT